MQQPQGRQLKTKIGVITSFTYLSDDKVFGVAMFALDDGPDVRICGNIGGYPEGAYLELQGHYQKNEKYKETQFVVTLSMPAEPSATAAGLSNYLAANFKYVGKVASARIVKHFGDLTISSLDENPACVNKVKGLNRLMKESIEENWESVRHSQRGIRAIILAMHDERIGKHSIAKASRAFRLMIKEGKDVHAEVMLSPYAFLEQVDVNFLKADKVALRLGYPSDGIERRVYGTLYQLYQNLRSGDCLAPRDIVIENTARFLAISRDLAEETLAECQNRGLMFPCEVSGQPHLIPAHLSAAEEVIAEGIKVLVEHPPRLEVISEEMALKEAQRQCGVEFNTLQEMAINNALRFGVSIITGGPGTGKTTTLNGIVKAFNGACHRDVDIMLMAPTGKAAKRMEESTGCSAKTIHRALIDIERSGHDYLQADIVVVDEFSMIDTELAARLIDKLPPGARLIVIGDVDQLPSIGPGRVLGDLIDSGVIPRTRLMRPYRFEDGFIKRNASNIVLEKPLVFPDPADPSDEDDCFFMEIARSADQGYGKSLPQLIAEYVVRLHVMHIPARKSADPVHDVQTLVPMRVGVLGADNLNIMLRDAINPIKKQKTLDIIKARAEANEDGSPVSSRTFTLREGDKIMQTRNNYDLEVFNGEVGVIESIKAKDRKAVARFQDKSVTMTINDLQDIDLAYAQTIHKSQGSEYDYVVMPISEVQSVMLEKTPLYTGITRAKKMLVMIGQRKALEEGVKKDSAKIRLTGLKQLLTSILPAFSQAEEAAADQCISA